MIEEWNSRGRFQCAFALPKASVHQMTREGEAPMETKAPTSRLFMAMFAIMIGFLLAACPAFADGATMPGTSDNLSVGLRSTSELVPTSTGFTRVYYDKKIYVEKYDKNLKLKSKKKISMELPYWGGFYASSDGNYYIVEGKSNTAEKAGAEVIRVIKYNKNWKKVGTAKIGDDPSIWGGEVRYPFDYGCVEFAELNGKIYIVTGHEGYVDDMYGQGHQGMIMIELNPSNMIGKIVNGDYWHSFAQYIASDGKNAYLLELSEGSRCTTLSRFDGNSYTQSSSVLDYGGSRTSAWAIPCHATVDGIALSANNVLGIGTSIDQSKYDSYGYNTPYNIYLTVTPKNNISKASTKLVWLTNFTSGGKSFDGVKITKVNDNRFLVTWEVAGTSKKASANDTLSDSKLHYIFIDANGNKLTKEKTASAQISDCQPVIKGSNIVFFASNSNMVNFYKINSKSGKLTKKSYRVAGPKASWKISKKTLTITGSGTVSTGSWDSVKSYVKKISIGKGIKTISNNAFNYLSKVKEVRIAKTVKKIGKEAFAFNSSLRKIYIPSSVKTIGKDIAWVGSYWYGNNKHVTYATIYAPKGSKAIKYAKKNKMAYKIG